MESTAKRQQRKDVTFTFKPREQTHDIDHSIRRREQILTSESIRDDSLTSLTSPTLSLDQASISFYTSSLSVSSLGISFLACTVACTRVQDTLRCTQCARAEFSVQAMLRCTHVPCSTPSMYSILVY